MKEKKIEYLWSEFFVGMYVALLPVLNARPVCSHYVSGHDSAQLI